MSTVEHASVRDRTVLAVPGPVGAPSSAGTNALIADGAGVCTSLDDVLLALGLASTAGGGAVHADPRPEPVGLPRRVLDVLGWRPESIEFVVNGVGGAVPAVVAALGWLEANGWVTCSDGFVERRGDTSALCPPRPVEPPK